MNKDNARSQHKYSKSTIKIERSIKPKNITWRNETQYKPRRRDIEVIQRKNELNQLPKKREKQALLQNMLQSKNWIV